MFWLIVREPCSRILQLTKLETLKTLLDTTFMFSHPQWFVGLVIVVE